MNTAQDELDDSFPTWIFIGIFRNTAKQGQFHNQRLVLLSLGVNQLDGVFSGLESRSARPFPVDLYFPSLTNSTGLAAALHVQVMSPTVWKHLATI
jgi:hypothetical protein